MTNETSSNSGFGTGLAGVITGGIALLNTLGNGNGSLLGGLLGGGNQQTALSAMIAQKDAEIAQLKGEKYADKVGIEVHAYAEQRMNAALEKMNAIDQRLAALEVAAPLREKLVDQQIARVADQMQCCCNASNAAIAALQATVAQITKLVVPNAAICPGWGNVTVTPAATTATTPAA